MSVVSIPPSVRKRPPSSCGSREFWLFMAPPSSDIRYEWHLSARLTGTPNLLPNLPMDPLLDLVRAMRLSGGVFLDAEFTSPWCVASHVGPEDYGAFLPAPAHVIAYHYVTEGRLVLRVGGGSPISVGAGEIILLPRNEPHQLG